ncbi:uncharacterized protein PHACADRAFT_213284 [Phanerochaete carnosa HHB-10118-sp]|uniref:Uncharacterized protein n=1 Tax=Phanerochaete carnosa (strain HHB-10118-sp) TaxID=650164 RepID=K5VXY6_PHACS|nr:uncharacterized protein PHACADRAFT_213284 [Phanerochaete carnosa HHB-10118-sp]EKM51459.1 hypothetical protein PHACADRAFT_213284 [Phanerochaete carnosa HHB-10118-sp]
MTADLNELIRLRKDVLAAKRLYKISPEPPSAIRLTVDFFVLLILPAAYSYYNFSTLDADVNYDADKTVPRPNASTPSKLARFSLLRDSEMLQCYQGKYRLSKEQAAMGDIFGY